MNEIEKSEVALAKKILQENKTLIEARLPEQELQSVQAPMTIKIGATAADTVVTTPGGEVLTGITYASVSIEPDDFGVPILTLKIFNPKIVV